MSGDSKTGIEPKTVFRIIDRETGRHQGVYSRACHDDYDFDTAERARTSNCHGIYKEEAKYKIAKYRVTYELIEDDVETEPQE